MLHALDGLCARCHSLGLLSFNLLSQVLWVFGIRDGNLAILQNIEHQ